MPPPCFRSREAESRFAKSEGAILLARSDMGACAYYAEAGMWRLFRLEIVILCTAMHRSFSAEQVQNYYS
jgi:hypothetical protein